MINSRKSDETTKLKDIVHERSDDTVLFVLMVKPKKNICLRDVADGVINSLNDILKRIKDVRIS